ncbi:MAG: SHD1 domain-containing protein, partial [Planctomycetaceae bacterium]|nr:SHD1 domain-containing protein [Planctomycetaceae bacterium]
MHRHFLTFLTAVVVCSSAVLAEEMRTWTDSSGAFTTEASLVSFDGKTVTLKKEDGKTLSLAIGKLSEADQRYLMEGLSSGNPFEAAERAAARAQGAPPPTSAAKTVDISNAKEVGDYGETSWSCPPDPSPLENLAAKKFTFRAGNVPFHSHTNDNGFFFSRDGKKVLYALQVPKPSIDAKKDDVDATRIFLGDVASGETNMVRNKLCLTPYGLSPDGSKAMFVQSPWEFGIHTGQKGKIIIVKCTPDNKLEAPMVLNPFVNQGQSRNGETADVESADWVSNDHILVSYSSGFDPVLVLLNINTGKALWRLKLDFGGDKTFTLSPGGKYCLAKAGKAMLLIETAGGKTIGTLDGVGEFGTAKYSFSPDGRKIASCGDEMIRIWDATTGASEEAFFIDNANSFSVFTWVSNQHLLAGNKLIDTTLQAPVWEYAGNFNNAYYFGGQFWYMMGNDDAKVLVGVTLPQKKVLNQLSGSQNDASLFAVQPGMTVALKMDSSISRDKDEIKRAMEEKLKANDLTIADNAPVTFLLKVTQEGGKTVSYTTSRFPMMGRGGGGTEVKYREDKYQLLVQQGDQTLWSRINVMGPPDVSLD